jgi:hypothetical protein
MVKASRRRPMNIPHEPLTEPQSDSALRSRLSRLAAVTGHSDNRLDDHVTDQGRAREDAAKPGGTAKNSPRLGVANKLQPTGAFAFWS